MGGTIIWSEILQMLGILLAIAVVFFLAWFVTRAVALNGSFNGKGKYFTVLEKFPVSKDGYIMLVKSFDKLLLVGATAGGMTLLMEFDAGSVDISNLEPIKQSFSSIFKQTLDSTLPDGKVKDVFEKFMGKKKGGDGDE
jgi:flagellar protein FliO/FliZ